MPAVVNMPHATRQLAVWSIRLTVPTTGIMCYWLFGSAVDGLHLIQICAGAFQGILDGMDGKVNAWK